MSATRRDVIGTALLLAMLVLMMAFAGGAAKAGMRDSIKCWHTGLRIVGNAAPSGQFGTNYEFFGKVVFAEELTRRGDHIVSFSDPNLICKWGVNPEYLEREYADITAGFTPFHMDSYAKSSIDEAYEKGEYNQLVQSVFKGGDNSPKPKPSNVKLVGGVKTLSLHFRSHRGENEEGYFTASINLPYQFIACAGEIQVAYGLDLKSLAHSKGYRLAAGKAPGRSVIPASEPHVNALEVLAQIRNPGGLVGTLDDKNTGETLGLGCFSGQTRTVGTVRQLVGAQAKPEQVKTYLEALRLERTSELPYMLHNPDVGAGDRAARAEVDRAAAERAAPDEKATAAERAAADERAAKVRAEGKRVLDAQLKAYADYKSGVAASAAAKAKYERDNATYQQSLAASRARQAKYEADRAAYEAAEKAAGRLPK